MFSLPFRISTSARFLLTSFARSAETFIFQESSDFPGPSEGVAEIGFVCVFFCTLPCDAAPPLTETRYSAACVQRQMWQVLILPFPPYACSYAFPGARTGRPWLFSGPPR